MHVYLYIYVHLAPALCVVFLRAVNLRFLGQGYGYSEEMYYLRGNQSK